MKIYLSFTTYKSWQNRSDNF